MIQYGLLGAGAVARSFIARLPRKSQELGPIAALSYRVASRIANSLRAGAACKNATDLGRVQTILMYSNPASHEALVSLLRAAKIDWTGRRIILCDLPLDAVGISVFRQQGASVASLRQIELPGRYLIEGDLEAAKYARGLVRQLGGRAIQLATDRAALFHAGMTMGTALVTPLLDRAAQCFRLAGLRDQQALELASALFERTSRDFGHSGRQSWDWHIRPPDLVRLEKELEALVECTPFGPEFLKQLVSAMKAMGRHADVSLKLEGKFASSGD